MYMHFFLENRRRFPPEARGGKEIDDNLFPEYLGEKEKSFTIFFGASHPLSPPHAEFDFPMPATDISVSRQIFSLPFRRFRFPSKPNSRKNYFFTKIDLLFILRLLGKMRMEKNDKKMPAHPNGGGGGETQKGRRRQKQVFSVQKRGFFPRKKRSSLWLLLMLLFSCLSRCCRPKDFFCGNRRDAALVIQPSTKGNFEKKI